MRSSGLISIGLKLVLLFTAFPVDAGFFLNLDFEFANLSGYSPTARVPMSNAFPGWVGYIGGTQVQAVWYDDESLGGSAIAITDSLGSQFGFSRPPLQGNDSALLFGGEGGPATISQTGLVPTGTRSLVAEIAWWAAPPNVTLGGQTITMIAAKNYTNFILYAGDVAGFAGQSVTLSLTAPVPPLGVPIPSITELDKIVFSQADAPTTPFCNRSATAVTYFVNGSALGTLTTDGGCGYSSVPAVWIVGGGGTGATGAAFVANGVMEFVSILSEGTGYTNPPSIFIAPPNWSQSMPLAVTNTGMTVMLTWPTNLTGFTLQSTTNLSPPAAWTPISSGPVVVNGVNTVTNPISGTQQFFRLAQ